MHQAKGLDPRHVEELVNDGFTIIPNAVSKELVDAALRAINQQLGKGIRPEEAESFVNGICFPELMVKPAITNLFNHSSAVSYSRALIGNIHPVYAGQIALRFPGWGCDSATNAPSPWWNAAWHIDGLANPKKPESKGKIGNFTCLLGVVLQDIPGPFCGNLIAYPGSHRVLSQLFKENPELLQRVEQEGEKGLPSGRIFPPLRQVVAKAGDITICHSSLAHSVAPNTSPNIRYMVYFRLFSRNHAPQTYRKELMTNLWIDWEGITEQDIGRAKPISLGTGIQEGTSKLTLREGQGSMNGVGGENIMKFSQMVEDAEKIFSQEKWKEAFELYRQLSDAFADDWIYNFKAGFCAAMGYGFTEKEKAVQGEKYIRQSINLYTDFSGGYAVLARILGCQKKYQELLDVMDKCLSFQRFPKEYNWALDLMVDGMRSIREALFHLGRLNDAEEWEARILSLYPEIEEKLKKVCKESEVMELWARGEQVMKGKPINWLEGQKIFSRLAALDPNSYWAHVQAAASFTYGSPSEANKAEPYCRQAIELDPVCLCGYAIYARNLQMQGKHVEAISNAEAMLNCKADGQHLDLALEGVRAARASFQALSQMQRFEVFVSHFVAHFPFWASQVEAVKSSACSVM